MPTKERGKKHGKGNVKSGNGFVSVETKAAVALKSPGGSYRQVEDKTTFAPVRSIRRLNRANRRLSTTYGNLRGCFLAIQNAVNIQKNDLHFVLTLPGFCRQSIAPMPSAFILRIRSASSGGVNPGLSEDAPRRFTRLGNPFLFSRVLQRGFELPVVQASFKGRPSLWQRLLSGHRE